MGKMLSFDELLLRIHPAASRVRTLAAEHPAMLIVFDLLVDAVGRSLVHDPLAERRAVLEEFAMRHLAGAGSVRLSPATTAERTVKRWYASVGSALDGVIAKRLDLPYQTGERTGMQKLKQKRTADCVVGGFRYASKGKIVGSLLLGLYDENGLLNHVGFCSAMSAKERAELTPKLEALVEKPGFTGQAPGGPSRWSTARTGEWEPLATKLVVEVEYDHFTGGRFRHGTGFLRWRPDKAPRQCTMKQVEREAASSLLLLGAATRSATRRSVASREKVAGSQTTRAKGAKTRKRVQKKR
jgi:ATP-dependent DNA ligase